MLPPPRDEDTLRTWAKQLGLKQGSDDWLKFFDYAAVDAGRFVAFVGRSMMRNVPTAEDLGLIELPPDSVLPLEELLSLPPEQTAIVGTGSQGEPFAALSLMASGDHKWIQIEEGDTVLISARPIPGNETKVSRVINGLLRRGARVFHGDNANVHVSGHAAREELKTFINVVRPRAFVPVHGEFRHLRAHAELAEEIDVLHRFDALLREESCGGHFRTEYQTADGEAMRDDENFCYAAAWEFKGLDKEPELHKEPLKFENVELAVRSYK